MARYERRRSLPMTALYALLFGLLACGGGGSGSEPDSRAPSGLTYGANPVEYVRGEAITPNALHQAGGDAATSFAVSPALPAGLVMNPSTGEITGTPTAVASQATYTVTASNAFGSAGVGLTLSVRAPIGHLISGRISGDQPGVSTVRVYRTTPTETLLAEVRVPATGLWSVEGATTGTYRVDVAPIAQYQGAYKFYPSSRSVTVGSSDVRDQDFCIAGSADTATICRVDVSNSTPKIGGAPVPVTVSLVNWGTRINPAALNVSIEFDTDENISLDACGASGQLPPGSCTATGSFTVPAYWSQYPGDHLLYFELRSSSGLVSSTFTHITLTQ